MNSFKLQAGDILVDINDGKGAFSLLKRWAIGPYEHVSLYLGMVRLFVGRGQEHVIKVPMVFEGIGRGVVLRSLFEKYSDKVVVMRLKSEHDRRRIPYVLLAAIVWPAMTRPTRVFVQLSRTSVLMVEAKDGENTG